MPRVNHPDVKYDDELKKITVIISKQKSAPIAKILKQLNAVVEEIEILKQKELILKDKVRDLGKDLFDESDYILNRVVIASEIVASIDKYEDPKSDYNTRKTSKVNVDQMIEEISKVYNISLDALEDIKTQYTKVIKSEVLPRVQVDTINSTTMKKILGEDSTDKSLLKYIWSFFKNSASYIHSKYTKKIDNILQKYQ